MSTERSHFAARRHGDQRRGEPHASTLLLVVTGVVLASFGAVAADGPMLELEASPTSVRVGDRVDVLASARGGEGWLFGELNVAVEPTGTWALVEGPSEVAGSRPPAWEFVLAPMAMGDKETPVVSMSARSPGGEVVEVSADSPVVITVVSVLPDSEDDPAPAALRDPIGVHGFPWEWVLPAAGILLPLIIGTLWWRRGRGGTLGSPRALLPPLAELEALAAELDAKVGREPADGICDRVAAGMRHYLERRTGEPAEEMTSFELRLLARRRGWPESTQRLVQQVMGVADGVRFGRRPSTEVELRGAISNAVEAARLVEAFLNPPAEEQATAQGGR